MTTTATTAGGRVSVGGGPVRRYPDAIAAILDLAAGLTEAELYELRRDRLSRLQRELLRERAEQHYQDGGGPLMADQSLLRRLRGARVEVLPPSVARVLLLLIARPRGGPPWTSRGLCRALGVTGPYAVHPLIERLRAAGLAASPPSSLGARANGAGVVLAPGWEWVPADRLGGDTTLTREAGHE